MEDTLASHLAALKRSRFAQLEDLRASKQKINLNLKSFGEKQIDAFTTATRGVLLGGNKEATKAYLSAILTDIRVYPGTAQINGGRLKLTAAVSKYDARAPDNWVPSIVTNWRRGRDSNPRYRVRVYSLSRGAPSATRPPLRKGAR